MKNTNALLLIISTVLTICCVGEAGSIYAKRNKTEKSVYADNTARRIGDVVTIVIDEQSVVDNKTNRKLANSNSRSSSFDGNLGIDHILPSIPGFTMNQQSSRSMDGTSDFKDDKSFTDKMSVVVEDIQPNGNLVVIGYREREFAGDKQTIQVSGIIRPSDILFDNSIGSSKVANFQIVTINDGVTDRYNEPGWLATIFDVLWPF